MGVVAVHRGPRIRAEYPLASAVQTGGTPMQLLSLPPPVLCRRSPHPVARAPSSDRRRRGLVTSRRALALFQLLG
eukprot:6545462-Prymnesium_polylepis.1